MTVNLYKKNTRINLSLPLYSHIHIFAEFNLKKKLDVSISYKTHYKENTKI